MIEFYSWSASYLDNTLLEKNKGQVSVDELGSKDWVW